MDGLQSQALLDAVIESLPDRAHPAPHQLPSVHQHGWGEAS